MTLTEQLAEQHIREYEARLKHLEEAHEWERRRPLQRSHDEAATAHALLHMRANNWREQGVERNGPMGIWDAVAQQLESLVERIVR